MVFLFKDDKKIVGFELTLHNIPGALNFVISVISKHNLNIHYIESTSPGEKYYDIFMAIDFSNTDVKPEDILKELKIDKKYVYSVSLSPTIDNLVYTSKFNIKDLGGIRAILFCLGSMKGFIKGIKDHFGIEAGRSFLYHVGHIVGYYNW